MTMKKKRVVLGWIGAVQDRAGEKRRPTFIVATDPELGPHRLEILHEPRHGDVVEALTRDLRRVRPDLEVAAHERSLDDPWDFDEVYACMHDFAASSAFDPDGCDYFVHVTTGTRMQQIAWFLLAEGRQVPARLVEVLPEDVAENRAPLIVTDLDPRAHAEVRSRAMAARHQGLAILRSGIDTKNAAFNRLVADIERVALGSSDTLLLLGPTGSGKSHLARQIFAMLVERRKVQPGRFVEVNCATLQGQMLQSTLFGHVRGAFTGAVADREGLLVRADRGLLLLDEVAELGSEEQAMLLDALDRRRFRPLGAADERASDFRLIAATNRDLKALVAGGRFRDDLWARLSTWSFELPPLAKRREDMAVNVEYELGRFEARTGTAVRFSPTALRAFLRFAESPGATWPHNFRDLQQAVTRMASLASGGVIDRPQVADEIERLRSSWRPSARAPAAGPTGGADLDPFDAVQLDYVLEVLARAGSLSAAGRELFSRSRRSSKNFNDADRLRKYLGRFGIDWRTVVSGGS